MYHRSLLSVRNEACRLFSPYLVGVDGDKSKEGASGVSQIEGVIAYA